METKISGTVKNIVFINRENGYAVLRTKDKRTLCGNLNDPSVNLSDAEFTATGAWKNHKKYGMQFVFDSFQVNESDLFYFLCRIVKGIGRKLAGELLFKYEENELVEILDTKPQLLLKVKGIKDKKLMRITESWNKFRELKNLSQVLVPYGATQNLVLKVYRHFLDTPFRLEAVRTNPYIITEVKGIGFKTADSIALKMGILPDSIRRIKASITYMLLKSTSDDGNSSVKKEELFKKIKAELDNAETKIQAAGFENALAGLVCENRVVLLNDQYLTSLSLYKAETGIIDKIKIRLSCSITILNENINDFIRIQQAEMGIEFSKEQEEAVRVINKGIKFFIICGYAGTGKTTISRAILKLLAEISGAENIVCCALSGIASDRIRKTAGFKSYTIQSLIVQANRKGGVFPCKVLFIDEASMINSELLYKLLCIIDDNCTVIMAGDPAQLPPIGAGNPFYDIIKKKLSPLVELTKIYRQDEKKVITYFADFIRRGEVPDNFNGTYNDFSFTDRSIKNYFSLKNKLNAKEKTELRNRNSSDILDAIMSIAEGYKEQLKNIFEKRELKKYVTFFQVITPVKKGILGTDNLNIEMQNLFNYHEKAGNIIHSGYFKLNLYDKVVHISNQDMDCYNPQDFKKYHTNAVSFKQRIYNGMIGILFKINKQEELLWVYYPADEIVAEYGFFDAGELLRLSYALTIHKTQGSEYENIVIPMSFSHFIMLNNKLLYTAVTRAKENCHIVGESYAFMSSCKRKDIAIRKTVMNLL